jgi:hypothetical protein
MKVRVVLLVCAIAVAVALSICGRKYTATAVVDVACRPLSNPPMPEAEVDACIEKQMEMLASKSVLTAALRKPEVAALPSVQAEGGDAVPWLGSILHMERPAKTDRIVVSCRMNDPHEAVVLANAVVDARIAEVREAQGKLQEWFDEVDSRAIKLEKELDEKHQLLHRIKAASLAGKAKAPSTPGDHDAATLQAAVDSIKTALRPLTDERDRLRVEIKSQRRITVVERAQEPKVANQPSL